MRLSIRQAAGAVLIAGLGASTASAAPVDALRAGDMGQMIEEVIAVYEDAGLSWDFGIEWMVGPYTTTYWFYNPNEDEVHVGAVPADDEIDSYWQTWSAVLTDGQFAPDSFFTSADDAREMAHFNQYVLATHESAHAITFRYDYGHLERYDYDINCREYHADRLTIAILNEQARLEPDMARWRDRYYELVTAMGETIPEQYRHHIVDFAALDADCTLIDVAQPTPETMQPYASAYFERYRVLLEADLPPMAEIFQTHLVDRWDAVFGNVPYAPIRDGLELVTLAELDEIDLDKVYGEERTPTEAVSRAAAFDPDGKLWFATLRYERDTRRVSISFDAEAGGSAPIAAPAEWHLPSNALNIQSLAVISADRFLVSLQHWDEAGTDGAERSFVTFLVADRTDGDWTLTSLAEVENMWQGAIRRSPSGRLFMIATRDPNGRDPTNDWVGFEISLEREDVVGQIPIVSGFDYPLAIDDGLKIYEESYNMLWASLPEGEDAVVIGNGHIGPRDGVGARAEVSDVLVLQWMEGGRALMIDRGPGLRGYRLRELRPVSAQ